MEREQPAYRAIVTAIHIDLKERSISFEDEKQTLARLTWSPEGVLFEGQPITLATGIEDAPTPPVPEALPAPDAAPERERTVTVTGRLKSRPKEGRPDGRGNPTSWARLAVHQEGQRDARMLLATFHRHTAAIARTLPRDAQLTAEGYLHPANAPGRLDTFSVVNLVNYPGKRPNL